MTTLSFRNLFLIFFLTLCLSFTTQCFSAFVMEMEAPEALPALNKHEDSQLIEGPHDRETRAILLDASKMLWGRFFPRFQNLFGYRFSPHAKSRIYTGGRKVSCPKTATDERLPLFVISDTIRNGYDFFDTEEDRPVRVGKCGAIVFENPTKDNGKDIRKVVSLLHSNNAMRNIASGRFQKIQDFYTD